MALLPDPLVGAPRFLLVLCAVSAVVATGLWWSLGRRFLRALFRRPRSRAGVFRLTVTFLLAVSSTFAAAAALALCVALSGYAAFTARTRVAEIHCVERAPTKLRVSYVAILPDGRRGPTQVFDVDGDEWMVSGEVLRFRPGFVALGLAPVHAVTRVEGRWHNAARTNQHEPTAHDVGSADIGRWTWLKRYGTRGPLRWIVAGAHGQAVSQLPDPRADYDLFITPNGYVVDKRSS